MPPITIAPTNVTTSTLDADSVINCRKKASSVSFSLDSNNEEQEKEEDHKEDDKQETRKNKVRSRYYSPQVNNILIKIPVVAVEISVKASSSSVVILLIKAWLFY